MKTALIVAAALAVAMAVAYRIGWGRGSSLMADAWTDSYVAAELDDIDAEYEALTEQEF